MAVCDLELINMRKIAAGGNMNIVYICRKKLAWINMSLCETRIKPMELKKRLIRTNLRRKKLKIPQKKTLTKK